MQVLATQFNSFQTRKFRVFFTDFQPNILGTGVINLFTLNKTWEVCAAKIRVTTAFASAKTVAGRISLGQGDFNSSATREQQNYLVQAFNQPINNQSGSFRFMPQRLVESVTPNFNIIGNQLFSYPVNCRITLDGGGKINELTAGVFEVWVTVARFP